MLLKAHSSGGRTAAFPSWNGCRCSILAAHDLEGALANLPRQDADCVGLMGVNVYGPAARLEFTGRAQSERSMTPCEKSKSMTTRDSCWKHTARRPLRKPPRTPSTLKQRARWNWPEPGGILKTP